MSKKKLSAMKKSVTIKGSSLAVALDEATKIAGFGIDSVLDSV